MDIQPFITRVSIDWDVVPSGDYTHGIPALHFDRPIEFTTPVTLFVGENGSGKSTLLESMAVAFGLNAEGGSQGYRFTTYDSHGSLHEAVHLTRSIRRPKTSYFLRAESFYNVASAAESYRDDGRSLTPKEIYYACYGGKSLHEQSHGESFLALVQNTFTDNGFYLLDEPEAALSPMRQLTLLYELHLLAQHGAQFIIATHSPILIGMPGARILSFDDGRIHEVTYEETEHYQVMEMFINRRQQILEQLLSCLNQAAASPLEKATGI